MLEENFYQAKKVNNSVGDNCWLDHVYATNQCKALEAKGISFEKFIIALMYNSTRTCWEVKSYDMIARAMIFGVEKLEK